MFETVECPYCEHENDMSDALSDGLSDDNTFDWECENCEEEFEVYVEFEPTYSASKIVYENCDSCGESVRDVFKRGKVVPFPKSLEGNKYCRSCFFKGMSKDYND